MTEPNIESVVTRVLAELEKIESPTKPTALVLFSGALLGFEEALVSLQSLKSEITLDYNQTESAKRILPQHEIEAIGMTPADKSVTKMHDMLIVATTTANLVAKVAHGIGDCLASNITAEFIMIGKPVVMATPGACPDSKEKRNWFPNMPAGYADMLRDNISTIKSFGVSTATGESLANVVLQQLSRIRKEN